MKSFIIAETNSEIPVPESYSDCLELIKSDYYRYTGRKDRLLRMWLYSLVTSHFGFSFWFRMSAYRGWLYPFSRFMHRMYYLRYGLQIAPETKVGYGLYLSHGFGIIVNPTAIIGNNCNLSQFSTIGGHTDPCAIIGDNVYVGPSVCVVNQVIIGSNSTIGAGAVVTKDVPENAIVAGVPAKVLSYNSTGCYVNKRWKVDKS